MSYKSTPRDGLTPFLWAGAVLLFVLAEAQIIVSYVRMPSQHTWLEVGRLLGMLLVVSVPGVAGLNGYSVVKHLPSSISGDDRAKLIWLEHRFLTIVIASYVAIGWVTRQVGGG